MLLLNRFTLAAAAFAAFALLIGCQSAPLDQSAAQLRIANTQTTVAECRATTCETLNIDRGDLPDFAVLADLDHVTALRMSWTDFAYLDDIAPMVQLTELHISSTQVTDLSGLAAFESLEMLHLQWSSQVSDLSPIANLPTLTELALGGNSVDDLEFISQLPNLDGLSLTGSKVTSLTGLIGHPTLTRLDLEMATLPDDISALLTIPNLAVVSVSPNRLSDRQMIVVDALRQKGVRVDAIPEVVVTIC